MFCPRTLDEVVGNVSAIQQLQAALNVSPHVHVYGPCGVGKRTILRLLVSDREEHYCSLLQLREMLRLFDSTPQLVSRKIILYDTDVLQVNEKTQMMKSIADYTKKHQVVTVGKYAIDATVCVKFERLTPRDINEVLAYVCVECEAWRFLDQLNLTKAPQSIGAGVHEIRNQSDLPDSFVTPPTMLHAHVTLASSHWEYCIELLSAVTQSQNYDAPSDVKYGISTAVYHNEQAVVARRQSVKKAHSRRLNCSVLDFFIVQHLLLQMAFSNSLESVQDINLRRALSYRQPRCTADRLRRVSNK